MVNVSNEKQILFCEDISSSPDVEIL